MLEVLTRELRRVSRERSREARGRVRARRIEAEQAAERARALMRGPSKLHYAWAIEPHKSGFPHVHMLLDQEWVDVVWLRSTWAAAAGVVDADVDIRTVSSSAAVSRYISKYISKSRLSLDILAIVKGRRLWWSTVKNVSRPEPVWIREESTTEAECRVGVENAESWGVDDGWSCEATNGESYALWTRKAEWPASVRVVENEFDATGESELAWMLESQFEKYRLISYDISQKVEMTTREIVAAALALLADETT